MKKKSNSLPPKQPRKIKIAKEIWVALVTGVLGLIGISITAYMNYMQAKLPIKATLIAETQLINSPSNTPILGLNTTSTPITTIPLTKTNEVKISFTNPNYYADVEITIFQNDIELMTVNVPSGTSQDIVLPPGSYKYKVTGFSTYPTNTPPAPPCYTAVVNTDFYERELNINTSQNITIQYFEKLGRFTVCPTPTPLPKGVGLIQASYYLYLNYDTSQWNIEQTNRYWTLTHATISTCQLSSLEPAKTLGSSLGEIEFKSGSYTIYEDNQEKNSRLYIANMYVWGRSDEARIQGIFPESDSDKCISDTISVLKSLYFSAVSGE